MNRGKTKRIAKENPDLTHEDIKGILEGIADVKAGKREVYKIRPVAAGFSLRSDAKK